MHTHATESYEDCDAAQYDTRNTWRSTDNNRNMVAVGNAIEEELRKAGIGVVHDTQQFDYPSYNGSYDRAAAVVRDYLTQYPGDPAGAGHPPGRNPAGCHHHCQAGHRDRRETRRPDHDPLRLSPQCRRLGGKSAHRRRSAEPAGEPLPPP